MKYTLEQDGRTQTKWTMILVLIFAFVFFLIGMIATKDVEAMWPLGDTKLSLISKEQKTINTDISAMKQVSTNLKNELSGVKLQVKSMKVNMNARMSAYDKSTNVGRDMTTTTVNDTKLMKYIVYVLGFLCASLIALLGKVMMVLVHTRTQLMHKDEHLSNVIASKKKRDAELDKLREEGKIK